MLIGKPGAAVTSIAAADATSITVRGRDLTRDLMGRLTFTEYFFLLATGHEATPEQRYFLDLLLVAIAEHGLTPIVQAARMTLDAAPDALQGALAAGILGCGSVVLGTAGLCGDLLVSAKARSDAGEAAAAVAEDMASTVRASGGRLPGFGHPLHRPVDPRAVRILELAEARGVAGRHVALARCLAEAVPRVWGKPLPMNVSMPTAAVLLDLAFPAAIIKAIPLLARTAGILAHLAEEQSCPIGFLMASHGEGAIAYRQDAKGDEA